MGQPITWQNVNQGDASTAWRGLDSAQKSINGAFDGLNQVVKGAEDAQAKNDVAIKTNNTQDYLNKLTEYVQDTGRIWQQDCSMAVLTN